MTKNRLEAFSDGVLAIIITIMVLELKVPHGSDLRALQPLIPVFVSYVLSFVYVGIYWNNHHHLINVSKRVSAGMLWANLHLLFGLSLFPFSTAWMGENAFAPWTVVIYGCVLIVAALAYYVLVWALLASNGSGSDLSRAVGRDFKGKFSVVIYAVDIALAFVHPWIGFAVYCLVACIWYIPDRRIEMLLE